jgi:hypothetical protein
MIAWEAHRGLFEWEGSWRDLYILDTQLRDWQRLLDYFREQGDQLTFMIDDIPHPLPLLRAYLLYASMQLLS